tara:strand:- start:757 stop:1266 length:510 start_codon:yes stop_codon:yes gene_type:complete
MSIASDGILSLLEKWGNMTAKKKGAASDKEYKSFMDKDSGTEHHTAMTPTKNAPGAVSNTEMDYLSSTGNYVNSAPYLAQMEAQLRSTLGGVGISPVDARMDIKELQSQFARILGTLQPQEQAQVVKAWSMSDDDGKTSLMNMIVSNPAMATGYGIQDEQPIKNLGIGY